MLIIMLVTVPVHLWEAKRVIPIPGWASGEACHAAVPEFEKRFGVTNEKHQGFWPWDHTVTREFLPAQAECLEVQNP